MVFGGGGPPPPGGGGRRPPRLGPPGSSGTPGFPTPFRSGKVEPEVVEPMVEKVERVLREIMEALAVGQDQTQYHQVDQLMMGQVQHQPEQEYQDI